MSAAGQGVPWGGVRQVHEIWELMTYQRIGNYVSAEPFRPFRVNMVRGQSLEIRHPEMAFLTRSTVEIGISEKEGVRIFDRVIYCTLLHIVRVEDVNGQATRRGEGA